MLTTYVRRWITIEHGSADPIQVGEWTATAVALVVRVRLPLMTTGIVWVRPAWVTLSKPGSPQQRLRIRDVTGEILLGLLGATLATG